MGGAAAIPLSPPSVRPRQAKEDRLREVKQCLEQQLITQTHYDTAVAAILLDT